MARSSDPVSVQHRFRVAPYVGREASEFRVVAKDVLDIAVDPVREPRQVGGFLDPGFRLGGSGRRDAKGAHAKNSQQADRHETLLGRSRPQLTGRQRSGILTLD